MLKSNEIKCLVWDLDNTIWNGVLSETPDVKLKPGIRDVIVELDRRGILQSIASKNNHDDAMDKLKYFELDQYFLYPEINWNAKSSSVSEIQKNLNIGINTFAFIDDEPYEREEVFSGQPEVRCFIAEQYKELLSFSEFMPLFITEDAINRRNMYLQDMMRNRKEMEFQGPAEEFLASLEMQFNIAEAREIDLQRAEELTVRTNQLNATGKTYSYDELNAFRNSEDHLLLVCELNDKFGSYGKIGLALIETGQKTWYIRLMLMSCRVISRGVGTVLLSHIMQQARLNQVLLLADFKKTDRNRMMHIAYKFANFKEIDTDPDGVSILENNLELIQPFPSYINVTINIHHKTINYVTE